MWISRIVCQSNTEIRDLDETLVRLKEGVSVEDLPKRMHFDKVVFSLPNRPEVFEKSKYLWGIMELHTSRSRYIYDMSGYMIDRTRKSERIDTNIPFYLRENDDLLLLWTGGESRRFGATVLSQTLFGNPDAITNVLFDTRRIYDDFQKQKAVFSVGFKDRRGSVRSGTLYGNGDDKDSMHREAMKAPSRTQAGIYYPWKDKDQIPMKIFQNGTIVIFRNYSDMLQMHLPFQISKELVKEYSMAKRLDG